MSSFPVLNLDTAPSASIKQLQNTQTNFGFIPNLVGVMATSPALTEAYLSVASIFTKSNLTATEQQVVLLTVSHYHECSYCMAAHTVITGMNNVNSDVINAIRNNQPITDQKLDALRKFTLLIVDQRGWVNEKDTQDFLGAGYEIQHILDILVGVAQKTMSNFTNHIANTPLDDAFSEVKWTPNK